MRQPTFKQLQTIARIAESGKVTGAAVKLGLTPAAVSITLKQLEDDVGVPLFARSVTGFVPTEAGRGMVLAHARIATILSELVEATTALAGGRTGHVTLGVVSTAKYFAPFLLAAFGKLHPTIEVSLRVGNRGEILALLSDFSLDMALIGRPPQEIEVDMEEIGPQPHVVIAAPDHPLVKETHVPASRLSGETFLLREPGSGTRALTERILTEIGAAPKMGMEISSNETIKQAVMAGLGVAMLSYHTIAHEVSEGRLAVLRIEGTPVVRRWFIVRNRKKQLLPSAASLWAFVADEGSSFLPPLQVT